MRQITKKPMYTVLLIISRQMIKDGGQSVRIGVLLTCPTMTRD